MAEDLILIVSIVVALGVGLGGGLLLAGVFGSANKRARALEDEVDELKREQTEYKQQVNQHFKKTASLFQGMTEQYKAIYSHLAEGSEALCSERTSPPALDLPNKPRLTDKPEPSVIDDKAESATDETGDQEAVEKKAGTKPAEKKTAPAEDDDNALGDAPNIPPMPGEASDKPKVH